MSLKSFSVLLILAFLMFSCSKEEATPTTSPTLKNGRTITVTIKVDLVKLMADYPNGGNITTHDVIQMYSNSGEDEYENRYLDKLITLIDPSDVIIWQAVPKTGTTKVFLNQYTGDANKTVVLNADPAPVPGTQNQQWQVTCKSVIPSETTTSYLFQFSIETQPLLTWQWDPYIKRKKII